jgi:hypothetical protein
MKNQKIVIEKKYKGEIFKIEKSFHINKKKFEKLFFTIQQIRKEKLIKLKKI